MTAPALFCKNVIIAFLQNWPGPFLNGIMLWIMKIGKLITVFGCFRWSKGIQFLVRLQFIPAFQPGGYQTGAVHGGGCRAEIIVGINNAMVFGICFLFGGHGKAPFWC